MSSRQVLEPLDPVIISQYISPEYQLWAQQMAIFATLDSTSTYLAQAKHVNICLAESQTAGRGRLGRQWFSPIASNIYLSLRWNFTKNLLALDGLSVALGVAVTQALAAYGVTTGIAIKWPNDIVWRGRKLAGILLELSQVAPQTAEVIIGVGMNVTMSQQSVVTIDQPWCDMAQIISAQPERNKLIGLLLNQIITALNSFQEHGLQPFLSQWQQLDFAYGQAVILRTPQQQIIQGIGSGVNQCGYFLLQDGQGQIREFNSGEVSLRVI